MVYAADLGSVASGVEVRVLSKADIGKIARSMKLTASQLALLLRRQSWLKRSWTTLSQVFYRNVAQFGSAYRLGRWGQEFESLHSENKTRHWKRVFRDQNKRSLSNDRSFDRVDNKTSMHSSRYLGSSFVPSMWSVKLTRRELEVKLGSDGIWTCDLGLMSPLLYH